MTNTKSEPPSFLGIELCTWSHISDGEIYLGAQLTS